MKVIDMNLAKNFLAGSVAAAVTAAAAAPLAASDFAFDAKKAGVEAGVSTLGSFIAPIYEINDSLTLRAPLHFGSYAGNDSYNGNPVSYYLDLRSSSLVLDYHPFQGRLRLSGGLGFGGYEAGTTITDPELGDQVFQGTYDFRVEQKKTIAPVLSVGFVQSVSDRLAFVGEVGGKFAQHELSTNLDAISDPATRANMADEIAAINDDLRDIKVIPFLTVGARFSF